MQVFLWFILITSTIAAVAHFVVLVQGEFPFRVEQTPGSLITRMVIKEAVAVWAAYLLFEVL